MDVLVERCAGLDVHRDEVVATVRVPAARRRRWDQQTRTFRATLPGLAALGEWLAEAGVTRECPRICVGMSESESHVCEHPQQDRV
jgi:hypothetical protein